ncbi:hypothetical protein PROVRUST_05282 [Providencia rustigianii DSM 4541]|uniref:Uncharacterized protein n=1 Tax=Providencia rustigianii DSM 4541 TaxID=500637 RepID=D1NYF1_9GAMM|nr:hypothetical protein PROVRUST_05282 [Providencia rustigianii DSM 4541]
MQTVSRVILGMNFRHLFLRTGYLVAMVDAIANIYILIMISNHRVVKNFKNIQK